MFRYLHDNLDNQMNTGLMIVSEELRDALDPMLAHIKENQELYYPTK
jgi:hypothetical protein